MKHRSVTKAPIDEVERMYLEYAAICEHLAGRNAEIAALIDRNASLENALIAGEVARATEIDALTDTVVNLRELVTALTTRGDNDG